MQPKAQPNGRATLLASVGAGLEYCDFVVYMLVARYLAAAFFPSENVSAGTLQSLGLFAAGYIARPLGGLVFGSRGDRRGRKTTFVQTTGLMACATFGIGCLPVYAQIGLWAPVLLVALRCVQGFSMGGELPGAVTFVMENTPPAQQGRSCAIIMASISAGSLIAATLLAALTHQLTDSAMHAWGWRVPFWCGGSLAFFTQLMRRRLPDSPQFAAQASVHATPLRTLLGQHRAALACGMLMAVFYGAQVLFPLYAPLYLNRHFGYAMTDIYWATTWSMVWAVVASLVVGQLIDRWGARLLMVCAGALWALTVPYVVSSLGHGGMPTLFGFCLLWQTATPWVVGSFWVLLTHCFPAPVRYSGLAMCINMGLMISSLLPALFARLIDATGRPTAVAYPYMIVGAAAALAAASVTRVKPAQDACRIASSADAEILPG